MRPRRQASTLWLQTAAREAAQEDTLAIEVFRRIDDGSPMRVTTRVALRVGESRPREIALGRALLDGLDPVAVTSDAPVRMSEDGELTVQVHAGAFAVEVVGLRASLDAPLRAVARAEILARRGDLGVERRRGAAPGRVLISIASIPIARPARGVARAAFLPRAFGGPASLALTTTRRGNPAPPPHPDQPFARVSLIPTEKA